MGSGESQHNRAFVEWIKIDDRLPEEAHTVLVARGDGAIFMAEYIPPEPNRHKDIFGDCSPHNRFFNDDYEPIKDLVWWSELPLSPE